MNTKMSIHRALGEIKLYDKKIVDLLDKDFVLASKRESQKFTVSTLRNIKKR